MEQDLHNKIKEAEKEYYKEVYDKEFDCNYILPSGKLLGENEITKISDTIHDFIKGKKC